LKVVGVERRYKKTGEGEKMKRVLNQKAFRRPREGREKGGKKRRQKGWTRTIKTKSPLRKRRISG